MIFMVSLVDLEPDPDFFSVSGFGSGCSKIPDLWVRIHNTCLRLVQGPPKTLPRSIYPDSSFVHPNQTLLYNCVELLDEK